MRRELLLFLGIALPSATEAAPIGVKLSFASSDAATTMAVSWATETNLDTYVQYGVASIQEHEKLGAAPQLIEGIGFHHEVELTGLQPNTTYKYRVGSQGDWSPEHTFTTAPNDACVPYTFIVLGDARSQSEAGPSPNWPTIADESKQVSPRFILNAGDLVKEGSEIGQWANWLEASSVVNPYIPMLPAIGNHDDGPGDGNSANYNRIFALPPNTVTGTEDYWYVVYGNLVIFSLSTQTFDDFGAQANWVESIAAQHPNKWKIAFFHHPVYTTDSIASHPPNEQSQNAHYAPAFDRAGIDVIVQSHNHFYERFRPLVYDPSNPEEGQEVARYGNGPGEGRLYVVSGGAGSFLNVLIERSLRPAAGSEMRLANYHYVQIGIAGNTLHYSAVRSSLSPRGGAGIMDSLTLTRPGSDPCAQVGDPDGDADGYPRSRDCDDQDPDINPGAAEVCGNAIDEDCRGGAAICPPPPTDQDHDGAAAVGDCDDNDPRRYPEATEIECNDIDEDCDCIDPCSGTNKNVCPQIADAGAPADQGVPDMSVVADAAAIPPDSGVVAPDATSPQPVDAGTNAPRPGANDCNCRSIETKGSAYGLIGLAMLSLVRRKRRNSARLTKRS